jgi:hypothetical protein
MVSLEPTSCRKVGFCAWSAPFWPPLDASEWPRLSELLTFPSVNSFVV